MIFVFILLLSPPQLDHAAPARDQAIEVVTYWEREAAYFEQHAESEGLHEAFWECREEFRSWLGRDYATDTLGRLRRAHERLRVLASRQQVLRSV